jgi:hypothetical protein
MRSADPDIRKQGQTCFGIGQAGKIKNRLKGNNRLERSGSDNDSYPPSTESKNARKNPIVRVEKPSQCRNDNGTIRCRIWFPETTINGESIPAGYRDVEMGPNRESFSCIRSNSFFDFPVR